jgi:Leucine-rich repeat (LRR) protein
MNGIFGVITAVAIIALGYFLFVKMAKPIYNLNEWTGRLWQWAEKNSIGRRKLPRYEDNLAKLSELDISFCGLSDIPSELCNVMSLTRLIINGNKLTTLPKEIGNLTNLKEINLSNNRLISLPDEITNLKLDSFFISGNPNLILTKNQEEWIKNIKERDK